MLEPLIIQDLRDGALYHFTDHDKRKGLVSAYAISNYMIDRLDCKKWQQWQDDLMDIIPDDRMRLHNVVVFHDPKPDIRDPQKRKKSSLEILAQVDNKELRAAAQLMTGVPPVI